MTDTPSPNQSLRPASLITANGRLAFGVTGAAVVLDQLSKLWVLYGLDLPEKFQVPVIGSLLKFTMVWNRGVSLGLFKADTWVGRSALILFAIVVVAILSSWARKAERRITALALGLVMGGALGNNLIDRIRFGKVVDFIDVTGLLPFFPWVFNVADSCITIGVVLLLVDTLRTQPEPTA